MPIEQRVEQHVIKSNNPYYKMLYNFCHLSKNLYNHGMFLINDTYKISGNHLKYNDIDKILRDDKEFPDYNTLSQICSSTACQQTLRHLDKVWKGYFNSLKTFQKNSSAFSGMPKPPKYLDKNGTYPIYLTYIAFSLKEDGLIHFPKTFNGFTIKPICINNPNLAYREIPSRPGIKTLAEVRFIPKNNYITVEVVYDFKTEDIKPDNGRYLGIDMGVDNIACVVNNFGETPFVIDGHHIKSVNQFWNKRNAYYQELAMIRNGKHSTNRLLDMADKRNNRVDDFLHKASKYIVDTAIKQDVSCIVIGKNDGWKDESNLGKKNNQIFVQIPHARLVNMITYKAKQNGIDVIEQEESYTSKASFLDMDEIPTHKKGDKEEEPKYIFSGKRTHRGLYISSNGTEMNADVNGAYNILRKCKPNAFAKGVEGVGLHPVRVTID